MRILQCVDHRVAATDFYREPNAVAKLTVDVERVSFTIQAQNPNMHLLFGDQKKLRRPALASHHYA